MTDNTPTPPAAPVEKTKTKEQLRAEAKAATEFAKHAGPQILVMHDEPNFYSVTTLEEMPGKTNTGQIRYRNHSLNLAPGLNFVAQTLFDMQLKNERFKARIDSGRIEVISNWGRMRVIKLNPMITKSADVAVLKKLLEEEKREDVKELLEDHILECEDTGGQGGAARRAQRAHNRGQPRRRRR